LRHKFCFLGRDGGACARKPLRIDCGLQHPHRLSLLGLQSRAELGQPRQFRSKLGWLVIPAVVCEQLLWGGCE
jgi:hypothetical protein